MGVPVPGKVGGPGDGTHREKTPWGASTVMPVQHGGGTTTRTLLWCLSEDLGPPPDPPDEDSAEKPPEYSP